MSDLNFSPEPPGSSIAAPSGSRQLDELIQMVRTAKIPNGLLFTGAPGTGKSKAAHFLAKACNCTRGTAIPCENCGPCKKLNAGMHPDYISLDLEEGKKNITISQIRDMGRMIAARPNEAAFRTVCIKNADLMNLQAQNALLKGLEEPPERTFFILCAVDGSALLPTILSRCRKIRFQALSPAQVCRILSQAHGIDPRTAHIAAHTMAPDVEEILAVLSGTAGGDWMRSRTRLIEKVICLMTNRVPTAAPLALSRQLSGDPGQLPSAMAVIRTLLRDLVLFRHSPEKIVNLDFFNAFEDISQMQPEAKILEWAECFHDTEKRLAANCGLRLTLDRFFLVLSSPQPVFKTGANQL